MKSLKIIKRITEYIKPNKKYLYLSLICTTITVTLSLLIPILIGKAVDNIIGINDVNFKKLFYYIALIGLAIAASSFFQWFSTINTNILSYKTVMILRKMTFEKLNLVPLKYIDSNSHGDIISRISNDVDLVSDGLLQGFTHLFSGIITILGTIIFMLTLKVSITLVVVFLTPVSLFVATYIAKLSHNAFVVQSQTRGELSGFVEEMVGNEKIVQAFNYQERAQQSFEEINSRLYKSGFKATFYSSISNPTTRFVNSLVYLSVAIFGSISVINGGMSIGQLTSFLNYANHYTKPFNEISGVVTELQTAMAAAVRVFKILDEPNEINDIDKKILKDCKGDVNIKDVFFSYSKEKELIKDFNLDVKKGQRIAIVGPTGCGKTTIINLLMRFYEIDSGQIKIDGVSVNDVTRNSIRKQFGMVLQDPWLFDGTIKGNIAYGKPDASFDEIVEAAKLSKAHYFIKQMPEGYDTLISESSDNISQGQKQLLSIARIILLMPPMLILDEATSNIDTRTEMMIQSAFNHLMKGRTSFIVAHRLSTIKEADMILVMNNGQIIEQGNHNELIEKKGFYYTLYTSQFL